MIDLYYWTTPNGHKITMMLEETGLAYRIRPVRLPDGEQLSADFLAISPNGRIPAIIDHAPTGGGGAIAQFESGAILLYLAEKCGQFLPGDLHGRAATVQWLFWQMAGLGPMSGQNSHFRHAARDRIEYAIDRYTSEVVRLYGVLDRRLESSAFMAGDSYTIADIATFPWIAVHHRQGISLDDFRHVKRWFGSVRDRPATLRAYAAAAAINPDYPVLPPEA